jgi:hypothetical protein
MQSATFAKNMSPNSKKGDSPSEARRIDPSKAEESCGIPARSHIREKKFDAMSSVRCTLR